MMLVLCREVLQGFICAFDRQQHIVFELFCLCIYLRNNTNVAVRLCRIIVDRRIEAEQRVLQISTRKRDRQLTVSTRSSSSTNGQSTLVQQTTIFLLCRL